MLTCALAEPQSPGDGDRFSDPHLLPSYSSASGRYQEQSGEEVEPEQHFKIHVLKKVFPIGVGTKANNT